MQPQPAAQELAAHRPALRYLAQMAQFFQPAQQLRQPHLAGRPNRRGQMLRRDHIRPGHIRLDHGEQQPPLDGVGVTLEIKGRDLMNGVPKEITINQAQIAEALSEPVSAIVEGVRQALENTAPELAADIVDQGIVLTGGGALLGQLDEVLRDATGLPVTVADDPLTCVALGTGRALEEPIFRGVLTTAL